MQTRRDSKILAQQAFDVLQRTSGISLVLPGRKLPLIDFEQAAKEVLISTQTELNGRTFAVRCKRQGEHPRTSIEAERHIGALLMRASAAEGVNANKQFSYLLCCEKGMISRLHASQLNHAGFINVAVYRQ